MASTTDLEIPLVGRVTEMARIQAAFHRAAAGQGSFLLVVGEAGVGKTRLVEDALADCDLQVKRGWCLPDTQQPLLPIREALRGSSLAPILGEAVQARPHSFFLIDGSGLLIARAERAAGALDPDIFAGMLEAIGQFVADSFDAGQGAAGLRSMAYRDLRVLIARAPSGHSLVGVFEGLTSERVHDALDDLLDRIVSEHADLLGAWSGDVDLVAPITLRLVGFMRSCEEAAGRTGSTDIKRELLFDDLLRGFRRLAREEPVVLFLDDIQWADATTAALLHYLARNLRGAAVSLVATLRPEDTDEDPTIRRILAAMTREDLVERLDLGRLDPAAVAALVKGTFGDLRGGADLVERLVAETAGNALFVRELLWLLVAEGRIHLEDGWVFTGPVENLGLSEKMTSVLRRRLGRLDRADQELLEGAAIVGAEFRVDLLACVMEEKPITIHRRLAHLAREHRLLKAVADDYRFDHPKIHEVLVRDQPGGLRKAWHAAVAECLLQEDDPGQHRYRLAWHLDQAGDDRAYGYAMSAAEEDRETSSFPEARTHYTIALAHAPSDQRAAVLCALGDIEIHLAEYHQAMEHFEEALGEGPPAQLHAQILLGVARWLSFKDRRPEALERCQEALELVDEADELWLEIQAHRGDIYLNTNHFDEAEQIALAIGAARPDDLRIRVQITQRRGIICGSRGDFAGARQWFEEALDLCVTHGIRENEAAVLESLASYWRRMEDWDRAFEMQDRCVRLRQEAGAKQRVAGSTHLRGFYRHMVGDLPAALLDYQASDAILAVIGDRHARAYTMDSIGEIHREAGNYPAAVTASSTGLELMEDTGDLLGQANIRIHLASYALDQADQDRVDEQMTWIDEHQNDLATDWGRYAIWGFQVELELERGNLAAAEAANQQEQDSLIPGSEAKFRHLTQIHAARIAAGRGEPWREQYESALQQLQTPKWDRAQSLAHYAKLVKPEDQAAYSKARDEALEIFAKMGNQHWMDKVKEI